MFESGRFKVHRIMMLNDKEIIVWKVEKYKDNQDDACSSPRSRSSVEASRGRLVRVSAGLATGTSSLQSYLQWDNPYYTHWYST